MITNSPIAPCGDRIDLPDSSTLRARGADRPGVARCRHGHRLQTRAQTSRHSHWPTATGHPSEAKVLPGPATITQDAPVPGSLTDGPTPIPATPFGVDSSGNPITGPPGNTEGAGATASPTDGDDIFCFPWTEALLVKVNGCTFTNSGFDGASYLPIWPDGNTYLHPTPIRFSSPLTGRNFNVNYQRMGFEADLPRIEGTCNRTTGAGCTLIPTTDKGTLAAFYLYFSTFSQGRDLRQGQGHGCLWAIGSDLPGSSSNFGRNAQYGSLLTTTYLAFGGDGSPST